VNPVREPVSASERSCSAPTTWTPKSSALLQQAALTADALEDLQQIIDREGTVLDGKPHPALVEARMQRLTMGRLLAGLWLPADEERSHQPHRGPRGFYGPQGVA
jgi:hypothetical protein